jgi:hypothetical protein
VARQQPQIVFMPDDQFYTLVPAIGDPPPASGLRIRRFQGCNIYNPGASVVVEIRYNSSSDPILRRVTLAQYDTLRLEEDTDGFNFSLSTDYVEARATTVPASPLEAVGFFVDHVN